VLVENPNTPKLDFEALEAKGLEPQARAVVDGTPIYFSGKMKDDVGRDLIVGYVEVEGQLHVRAFYASTSQVSVRSASHFAREDGVVTLYGKAYSEESTNLPLELIPIVKNLPYTKSTQDQLDFFFNSILTDDFPKDWNKITLNGRNVLNKKLLQTASVSNPKIFNDPKNAILENPADGPDYRKQESIFTVEHDQHGTVTGEFYLSKNGEIRWLVLRDEHNRVMFGGAEIVGDKVTKLGVRSKPIFLSKLGAPIMEYRSQINPEYYGGNDPNNPNNPYVDNTRFLERTPLIQEYREVRGVQRPEVDPTTGERYDWSELQAQEGAPFAQAR
jgi:hypothetical protein